MGGATGLDYAAVHAYLRGVLGMRGNTLRDTFDAIQAAERAVLELRAEQEELSRGH